VTLLVEQTVGSRVLEALKLSLGVMGLRDLRLHRSLAQELLATEPRDAGTTKSLATEENLDVTIG